TRGSGPEPRRRGVSVSTDGSSIRRCPALAAWRAHASGAVVARRNSLAASSSEARSRTPTPRACSSCSYPAGPSRKMTGMASTSASFPSGPERATGASRGSSGERDGERFQELELVQVQGAGRKAITLGEHHALRSDGDHHAGRQDGQGVAGALRRLVFDDRTHSVDRSLPGSCAGRETPCAGESTNVPGTRS